jgi:cell division protein FtsB
MDLLFELRLRARHVVWPALAVCALVYVAYHIVQGDRGLIAWKTLRELIGTARVDLAAVEAERAAAQHRVRLLHPDGVDRDMVDEWARRLLNYGQPDELVIITEAAPAAADR